MTLKLLADTCVWLDLAKDHREEPTIEALQLLIETDEVELTVPQLVLDEFDRSKGRVIADAKRSLQSHFKVAKEAVGRFGEDITKAETLKGKPPARTVWR